MRRTGLSTVPAVLCLSAALALTACSSTPKDITQGWTPERIYSEARDEVSAGAWDKAIGHLDKLEGRARAAVNMSAGHTILMRAPNPRFKSVKNFLLEAFTVHKHRVM